MRLLTAFLAAGLLLAWAPVRAQGFREAEIEYNRGALLLEMRDWPRAVFAFTKAYSFVQDARYLAGLVKALHGKGDKEKAVAQGELYLERAGGSPDPDVVAIVAALRNELGANTGRVDLFLSPSGGKLTLTSPDGRVQVVLNSEATLIRWLPVGKTRFEYEKDGFSAAALDLDVKAETAATGAIALARAEGPARLQVESNVDRSRVLLDGKEAGVAPLLQEVPAGDHVVQVWAENHLAWTGVVDLPAGQVVKVKASLVPAADTVRRIPTPRLEVHRKSRFWRMSTWGWITMGLGVGTLGGAGYLATVWSAKNDETAKAKNKEEWTRLNDEAYPYFLMTLGTGIGGGILAGGGLLMVLMDKGDDLEDVAPFEMLTISPSFGPDGAFLGATLAF
ncbi:MAG: PEGA domain-containing protein [Deltaproteobacteria bacterium]|nr:PEGA domain-containing protein [Deltaproteobacteria bacterium]